MFTYGAGPLGEITCGCYPDANTNTPKNLSCKIFANPRVHDKPVHSQSGSPEQFCREQGYTHSVTNINASNFIGNLSKWNGSVWEINPDGLVMDSVSCCKLEDKTSDTCVASGCAEGQYWCQAENICKLAGQTCNATTCNTNTPVKWTQFNNPSAANINNPSAASLGSATGSIQLGSKNIQVSYTGDVRSVGIADNWSWVWTGNTAPFLSTLVPNIPDHTNLL